MFIYFVIVILMINLLYIHGGFKSIVNINGWSFITQSIYFTIYNMVQSQIGLLFGLFYFSFIFVIFAFILFSNLLGLIPYNFAITAHLVTTLSMSSAIWFGVSIIGIVLHALKFFTLFSP